MPFGRIGHFSLRSDNNNEMPQNRPLGTPIRRSGRGYLRHLEADELQVFITALGEEFENCIMLPELQPVTERAT